MKNWYPLPCTVSLMISISFQCHQYHDHCRSSWIFLNIYSSAFLQCFNISSTSFTDVLWINSKSTWVQHFSIIWTPAHVLKAVAQDVRTYNEEESHYPAMLSVTAHIIIVNTLFGICYDSVSWRVLTHRMQLRWVYMQLGDTYNKKCKV